MVFRALRVLHAGDAFHTRDLLIMDKNNGGSGVEFPVTPAKAGAQFKNIDIAGQVHRLRRTTACPRQADAEVIFGETR